MWRASLIIINAMKKITRKQQKFIDSYSGDTKEAAKISGLSYEYCRQLITKPYIIRIIQEREATERVPTIATRQQRQEFWTVVCNDKTQSMKDRLRASELLGKSEKDFVERVEMAGPDGGSVKHDVNVIFVRPGDIDNKRK